MQEMNDRWNRLHARLQQWCNDRSAAVACPSCSADGLTIEDRSARPYAEWYIMCCGACGLQETMQIPRGSLPIGID